jgi:predicted amidophosphoribosyltransferase
LADFFFDQPVLVPAPRSSLVKPNSLYPTQVICDHLVANGLGVETRILLERVKAVPKAAFSRAADRPTIQTHYDSLRVAGELLEPRSILLVDDVVTRGTMLLASATRLQEEFPGTQIRVFALIRTMSHCEIERIEDICAGTIEPHGDHGVRTP